MKKFKILSQIRVTSVGLLFSLLPLKIYLSLDKKMPLQDKKYAYILSDSGD